MVKATGSRVYKGQSIRRCDIKNALGIAREVNPFTLLYRKSSLGFLSVGLPWYTFEMSLCLGRV